MTTKELFTAVSKLLGREGWFWFSVAVVSSAVVGLTDYGIAIFIEVLLKNLGLVEGEAPVAEWLSGRISSEQYLLVGLATIGLLRGLGQFGTFQGSDLVHELVNSRLRLLAGYDVLQDPSGRFVSAADTHLKIGEIFPKAGLFLFYGVNILAMLIQCVIYLIVMLYLAWKEATIGIVGAGLIGLAVLRINKQVRRAAAGIPDEQKALVTGVQRTASNWLLVNAFRTSDQEHDALVSRNLSYFKKFVRAKTLGNIGAVLPTLAGVALLIAIIYASMRYFQTPGLELIACIYLFGRFSMAAGRVAKGFGLLGSYSAHFLAAAEFVIQFDPQAIASAAAPLRRVSALGVEKARDPQSPPQNGAGIDLIDPQSRPPEILVENVSYSYSPTTTPVLENASFSVRSGEQVGIVGESGSGKSTLLALIFGVLDPAQGRVSIDGLSPDQYFQDFPRRLGYVGSEPFLVEGTIKDNLDYGTVSGYTDEQYRKALNAVHLQDLVESLENKINYVISESGEGLSAGQKQRLSLARSLLRNPKVLILDEVTSNLDTALENEIATILNELKGFCTIVIVSHRVGILKFADRVYKLTSSKNLTLSEGELSM